VSRILIVDDEAHIADGLAFNLRNAGYEVEVARTSAAALEALGRGARFDLVLLDVMLPGDRDGLEVARMIRRGQDFTPIIMLTAKDLRDDRIAGLDAGADDYITKPFDLDELLARVRGHLRRRAWMSAAAGEPGGHKPFENLEFGDGCKVDFQTYQARTVDGREVALSQKEAMIMRLFAEHEGQVVTRATLLEKVWGEPRTLETRTMDNFILRLRRYFEKEPGNPRHILSVRGAGYRFVR
jgi:DNA-binding response OmpR family regulator